MLVSIAQDANADYRSYMEDGYALLDPMPPQGPETVGQWGFFAVYDGHGGAKEMQFCEANLHSIVASELRKVPSSDHNSVRSALTTAFKKVDEELRELGSSDRSGCTATVALSRRLPTGGVELHVGNVGDSRALLVDASGIQRLSVDHRTTESSELTRIKAAGGFVYNCRVGGTLSVTRALGDHYLTPSVSCEPDVSTYELRSPDEVSALVIASDGLWDSVDDDEVQEVLTLCINNAVQADAHGEAVALDKLRESAAKTLVEKAKSRGSRDNITVLVAFF